MTQVFKNRESSLHGSRKGDNGMQKHHLEDGMRRIRHPIAGSEKAEAMCKDQREASRS